ncbi:MAG: ComEC/Rec2 family competence protein [bacterium]|nr:ComEC/Rec2 family competence protein [bacterium]
MLLYQKAFWAIVSFLLGVILASALPFGSSAALPLLIGGLMILGIALFGRYQLALCAIAMLVGSLYYHARSPIMPETLSSAATSYIGVVEKAKLYADRQTLTVAVSSPGSFVIQMSTQRYPTYAYGDEISAIGVLTKLESEDTRFLRDRVVGQLRFPKIERVAENQGSAFRALLFNLRDRIAGSFQKTLPPESATFMTGLTLGKSAAFSRELQDQMKITGTTHMVALSGTNVTIIVKGVILLFGFWFSRRALFPLTLVAITLFVLMTGAEASVVRAAIMASIVLLAERTGRVHVTYSAIAAAAFLMVLLNPSVLAFDIGFQLSFFALLGIVYIQPVLEHFFRVAKVKNKFLIMLMETLCATLAAQLAVFPISLVYFGFASILSVIPNLLILLLIPYTMLGGLIIFLVSLFSSYLALLVALPARFLLGYELGVIHFFSRFKVGVATESFPMPAVILYYALVIFFVIRITRREHLVIE